MKVIFTQAISGVAANGDVKNVKPGYYRNFLQPFKKAVPATEAMLKEWEERRKQMVIQKEQFKSKIEETKRRLAGGRLRIEKKITAKGTLYGGVKTSDIAKAAREQFKLEIPEEAIKMPTAIKAAGSYDIALQLGENVTATLPIEIVSKA